MATRLTFLLDGRDQISRVLDRIGDNANQLSRRMLAASINGDAAMRRLGNSTTQRMAAMQRDTNLGAKAVDALKGALISLAPAAIPMAASLAPIAPAVGAAAAATAAYAVALGPQVAAMVEAAEAEKKYTDAVKESGARSQEAIEAHAEYVRTMADLPPATRRAAAELSVLKDEYKQWSDSLADDTMGPVIKGMALFRAGLPATTGLVKGMSRELDRTLSILAGGMASPGLDGLNRKFTDFTTGTLARANSALVRLMQTDTGKVGGGVSEFMDYARANGPAAAETVENVGRALLNLVQAGSEVGVSLLDVVNVLAGIAAAVPPGAIATLLQLAIAIKAVRLAAVGLAAARTAVAAFGVSLIAMQAAAAAAPGRMAAVTAAWGAMSRGARLAAAGTGIGLLVIAMMELSEIGKEAPPDIDKLTSSLGQFAQSGKVAGEAARLFGSDLGGLIAALNVVPQKGQDVDEFFRKFKENPTSIKDAKEQVEALDKSLASMVSSGKGDLAASALARIKAEMVGAGMSTSDLNGKLTEYKDALAAAAFEQQLIAQSMGLFGAQAQQVQAKLDAQKASADGLAQSINALSNQYIQARGGIRGMEAAIDAATTALKANGATLDEGTEKGRANNQALDDIATSTIKAAEAARANGASWAEVNAIYEQGRTALISSADAMGKTRGQAKALADQILQTPNKTAKLKGNMEDLQAKLDAAKAKLAKLPDSRQAKVRADISDLKNKLANAQRAIDNLRDGSVTITTRYVTVGDGSAARKAGSHGSQLKAEGGLIHGPGTGTSDDVPIWASNGEFMVKAKAVAKYGVSFLKAVNEGRLNMGAAVSGGGSAMAASVSGAGGGLAGAGEQAGRGLSAGLRAAAAGVDSSARVMASAVEAGIRAELQIASPSKKTKALAADVGKGFIAGLTGSKAKIAAVAKDLVKDIVAAWKGVNTNKDSKLVAMVNRDTKKLQGLATERDRLAARIAAAKDFAKTITAGARQDAALGSLGIAEEDVSAGSIKGGLADKLAKLKQFTSYIKTLAKRGLNKSLLRQVLEMGPEQGYAYASALAGADASTFKAINSLETQINHGADALGLAGADGMYDAGANAGKGFLTGLASQQKAIEKQMLTIAKAMEKAIKKALGIKSPSRVMAGLGRYTTEGLAVGMTERLPVLDAALSTVTDRVASTRPVIGRPAVVGAGAGGVVYNIPITIEQAMDPIAVAREFQKVLVKYGRAQGATVNFSVGR